MRDSRTPHRHAIHCAALAMIVLVAACGGGGNSSTGPSAPAATAHYQGVFASGAERGIVSLQAGSPATGTLTLGTSAPVSLTGTYTTATAAFNLSGGGYVVQGAVKNNTVTGTATGGALTTTATVSAVAAASADATTRYCGVYMGDDSGMADFIVSGGVAAASVTGMGGGFGMTGTVSGSSVTVTVTGTEPGTGKTNTVTANLSVSGSTIGGSGSSTLYPAQRVNITASTAGCGAPPPAGPFTSFVGFAGNNGVTGLVTLTPGSPATGTIKWNGGAPIALSGSYDAATGKFVVSGGGVGITATASGLNLTGNATGLNGGVGVWAMGSSAATPVVRYCGSLTGGKTGTVIMLVNGSNTEGLFMNSGTSAILYGSAGTGWAYMAGGRLLYMAATGTSAFSGTWAHDDGTAGSWTASGC